MSSWLRDYRPVEDAQVEEEVDKVVSEVLDRVESKEGFAVSFLMYRQVKKEAQV